MFFIFYLLLAVNSIELTVQNQFRYRRDSDLTTTQLIEKYGYPQEKHHVVTQDGYILEMHRITRAEGKPVFLMHGLLDSSATWVMSGPKAALGYILYDMGYDVWMGNARGTIYSQTHVRLKANSKLKQERGLYWNFDWHEIGKYDLPAFLDYVTGFKRVDRLHYIGHSQGTTSFFVMASERPEYNRKILLMSALAPPVYMSHVSNKVLRLAVKYLKLLQTLYEVLGYYNFTTELDMLLSLAGDIICMLSRHRATIFCDNNYSIITGQFTPHINSSTIPVIRSHTPAGASIRQLAHYGQLINNGRWAQFDFGPAKNLGRYGKVRSPDYSLRNVTAPVALFYSDQDELAASGDVVRLAAELPNLVISYKVRDKTFNHLDFVWGKDAKELCYDFLFDQMQNAEHGHLRYYD